MQSLSCIPCSPHTLWPSLVWCYINLAVVYTLQSYREISSWDRGWFTFCHNPPERIPEPSHVTLSSWHTVCCGTNEWRRQGYSEAVYALHQGQECLPRCWYMKILNATKHSVTQTIWKKKLCSRVIELDNVCLRQTCVNIKLVKII